MKPVFGIDLTENKKNEMPNGAQFLVARPSAALAESLSHSSEEAMDTVEKAKLPLPLRIAKWICEILGILIAAGIVRGLGGSDGVTLGQAYQNAPWLFWLCGVCLLGWGILTLIGSKQEKTVLESDEGSQTLAGLESIQNAVYAELSVPDNAREVDVLTFFYKVKNGEIKVCEKAMQMAQYFNPVFKAYADSENLYLVSLEGRYAFPLSAIGSIRTVKKHIRIMGWNKEQAINEGFYKQFKLTRDQYGCVHCKEYGILELTVGQETWGLYVPCYDLPVFRVLTGLKAPV